MAHHYRTNDLDGLWRCGFATEATRLKHLSVNTAQLAICLNKVKDPTASPPLKRTLFGTISNGQHSKLRKQNHTHCLLGATHNERN